MIYAVHHFQNALTVVLCQTRAENLEDLLQVWSMPMHCLLYTSVKKTAAQMDISGLNLLLVEDNELNAEIAKTLLSDEGANLTVAEDGLQAVRMFQRNRKVILTQF